MNLPVISHLNAWLGKFRRVLRENMPENPRSWEESEAIERGLRLELPDGKEWWVAWSGFMGVSHGFDGAEGCITITFASVEVVIRGVNLTPLFSAIGKQRLKTIRTIPLRHEAVAEGVPCVCDIQVRHLKRSGERFF